jgi:hypothetical protein
MIHIQETKLPVSNYVFDGPLIKKCFNFSIGASIAIALIGGSYWVFKAVGSSYPLINAIEKVVLFNIPTVSLSVFLAVFCPIFNERFIKIE